jgi:acetyl-CoA carboxylase beta subunit
MSNGGSTKGSSPLGGEPLFTEVCSTDVLGFSFGGRSYQDQLHEAVAKTKGFCGVDVSLRTVTFAGKEVPVVWVAHNFAFLGGCVRACVRACVRTCVLVLLVCCSIHWVVD